MEQITIKQYKEEKQLFNKFNGFGGNMNYLFRSAPNEDGILFEYRFVHNSMYSINSNGKNLNHSISWYDVLIMDLHAGEPNTIHHLMSTDVIEEVFNVKLI